MHLIFWDKNLFNIIFCCTKAVSCSQFEYADCFQFRPFLYSSAILWVKLVWHSTSCILSERLYCCKIFSGCSSEVTPVLVRYLRVVIVIVSWFLLNWATQGLSTSRRQGWNKDRGRYIFSVVVALVLSAFLVRGDLGHRVQVTVVTWNARGFSTILCIAIRSFL